MQLDDMLGFETGPSLRQITVWRDDGNGKVLSKRIALPISSLQEVLRDSAMVDDGAIRWIGENTVLIGALRVRDADTLMSLLEPFNIEPDLDHIDAHCDKPGESTP